MANQLYVRSSRETKSRLHSFLLLSLAAVLVLASIILFLIARNQQSAELARADFESALEDEDYIVKSPVRRIHRVKTAVMAKEVLSDENLETLRDRCGTLRDLAIVDILASTGMRVGELVGLNIADVNLQERECLVTGKGNKQNKSFRNTSSRK